MKVRTICFLIRGDKVCLGLKKRGFGVDKYNGFGGKVGDKEEFKNETIEESVLREGQEEFQITVLDLEKVGEVSFNSVICHVFISRNWIGEPGESEEMKPEWFKISEVPYDRMWEEDRDWVPMVLDGKKLKAKFNFSEDDKLLEQKIEVVTSIERK